MKQGVVDVIDRIMRAETPGSDGRVRVVRDH